MIKLKMFYILLSLAWLSAADTFTHKRTGESFDGYRVLLRQGNRTQVRVDGTKAKYINLADYNVAFNYRGRKQKVFVLPVTNSIELVCETEAFEKAIVSIANQGPLFIVIEIDTPGGRVDLTKRMCKSILKANNCETVAFVKGGKYGGALSGGAALALACDRIYMADETTIGAATMITTAKGEIKSLKDTHGGEVGEKMASAWRAYMRMLAESNGRNGLLVSAMVDRDIEVIEVEKEGERLFIDPGDKKKDEKLVRNWSKSGTLLTLTFKDAYDCNIADGIIDTRKQILPVMKADGAKVVIDTHCQRARTAFKRIQGKFLKSIESVNLSVKRFKFASSKTEAYVILKKIRREMKSTVRMAEKHEDLNADIQELKDLLYTVEAAYEKIKKAGPN